MSESSARLLRRANCSLIVALRLGPGLPVGTLRPCQRAPRFTDSIVCGFQAPAPTIPHWVIVNPQPAHDRIRDSVGGPLPSLLGVKGGCDNAAPFQSQIENSNVFAARELL